MTASDAPAGPASGGCQCGAVRFRVTEFGRASLCHCRMCQKAFGGIGGALVSARAFTYTRGQPAYFQSSNRSRRGFCAACGTPLTFETGAAVDIAIAALDKPELAPPVIQMSAETRLPWVDDISQLPTRSAAEEAQVAAHYAGIVSYPASRPRHGHLAAAGSPARMKPQAAVPLALKHSTGFVP